MTFFEYAIPRMPELMDRTIQHVGLTLFSVIISILIGVPLGILITYIKQLNKPVLGFANLIQAVPSIALLGFLVPVLGIGEKPAIFMVVVYSLLPIVKNTATGLSSVNSDTIEAAKGIGMTNFQILARVKLPLSLPVIMAGIRISAVTSVGLVTIAAFIGAGGLGYLIYSGIQTNTSYQILLGAIPACILALVVDFVAAIVEKIVTPACFKNSSKKEGAVSGRKKATLILLSIIILCVTLFGYGSKGGKSIVVGSKNYTEQDVLGNVLTLVIEDNTDLKVTYKNNMGSNILFSAIQNGDVDVYVDYSGTVYGNYLKYSEMKSSDEVYDISVKELKEKYKLLMLKPLGFNNTYCLAVSPQTASEYNLKTLSDLAKVSSSFVFGGGFEILNRNDGIPELKKAYNMSFKEEKAIEGVLRYTAIEKNETQVTEAYSTDGMLLEYDLVVLEDDKSFFPPYNAAPIIREETANKYPELLTVLDKLTNTLTDESMRDLNYKVDVLKQNPKDVAQEFLKSNNLIK